MKKLFSLFLSVMFIMTLAPFATIPASAESEYISGDYDYTVANGKATITDYHGAGGNVTIPSVLDAYPVTTIDDSAFSACTNLTGVTIPDSVTWIGNYAFSRCSNLTYAFIPGSVSYIRYYIFLNCSSLTDVIMEDGITSIESGMFSGCSSLKNITLPDTVEQIKSAAFGNCSSLTSIILPNGVTKIGDCAFEGCSGLTSIVIPDSVTSIGVSAFKDCKKLEKVYITDLTAWCNINFLHDDYYPYGIYCNPLYYGDLYLNNQLIKELVIPDCITTIKPFAFYKYNRLTSVTIPSSVTSIERSAFEGCSGLTSVTIPDSVFKIGQSAFPTDIVIRTSENSSAHRYAVENDIKIYLTFVNCPDPPKIQDILPTCITLQAVEGYEYKCGDGIWQESNVFNGLVNNTEYIFYQRVAASDKNVVSESSKGTTVTTSKKAQSTPSAPTIERTDYTSITLTPYSGYEYRCNNGAWQTSNIFSGLTAGTTYTFYQRVAETDTHMASQPSAGKTVTTKEKAENTTTVPAPVVSGSTADSITLKTHENCEYSKDGIVWQKNNTFTGIVPGRQYIFYQRIVETETVKAGPASAGRKVKIFPAGDIDGDKEITDWDGVLLTRYLAGWNVGTSDQSVFDIDGDGKITSKDSMRFDCYLAGWNVTIAGTGETVITYTITYENLKGAANPNPLTYDSNRGTTLSSPSLKHYRFAGWYNGDQKTTKITGAEEADLVLTAKWSPIVYTVTYKNADGYNGTINSTYTIEDTLPISVADTASKYFAGWFDESGNQIFRLDPDKGNMTLTARWEDIEPLYITTSGDAVNSLVVRSTYTGHGFYRIEVSFRVLNVTGEPFVGFEILVNGQTRAADGIASEYGKIHEITRTIQNVPAGNCHVHVIIQ